MPSWGISSSSGSADGGYWDFLPLHQLFLDAGQVYSQGLTGPWGSLVYLLDKVEEPFVGIGADKYLKCRNAKT